MASIDLSHLPPALPMYRRYAAECSACHLKIRGPEILTAPNHRMLDEGDGLEQHSADCYVCKKNRDGYPAGTLLAFCLHTCSQEGEHTYKWLTEQEGLASLQIRNMRRALSDMEAPQLAPAAALPAPTIPDFVASAASALNRTNDLVENLRRIRNTAKAFVQASPSSEDAAPSELVSLATEIQTVLTEITVNTPKAQILETLRTIHEVLDPFGK